MSHNHNANTDIPNISDSLCNASSSPVSKCLLVKMKNHVMVLPKSELILHFLGSWVLILHHGDYVVSLSIARLICVNKVYNISRGGGSGAIKKYNEKK